MEKFYSSRRCLVTGHTGFKGSWLTLWLRKLGATVTGYALDPPTQPNLCELAGLPSDINDARGDVRDADRLAKTVQLAQPEVVFHLAAQPIVLRSFNEPKYTFEVNIGGTVNLLEACRNCPSVKALVIVTSDKCYENLGMPHAYRESDPMGGKDPYSASKGATELVCASYRASFFAKAGVGLATARAGNVIGGGDWAQDRIIPDAVRAIEANVPMLLRNPAHVRPWQHVLEPLSGYLLLGVRLAENKTKFAEAWNFAPDTTSCRPVKDLVSSFFASYGSGSWTTPAQGAAAAPPESSFLSLSYDKAFHNLAWHPRWGLDQAVAQTAHWYRRLKDGASARQLCLEDIKSYMEVA